MADHHWLLPWDLHGTIRRFGDRTSAVNSNEIQLTRSTRRPWTLLWILVSIALIVGMTIAATRGYVPIDHRPQVIAPAPQSGP